MADLNEKIEEFTNTEDTTSEFDANDIANNKAYGILAYLGILILIPLFVARKSKFARYHTNQGLILIICEIVLSAIMGVLWNIPLMGIVRTVVGLAEIAYTIIGILNVANGRAKELPIIGRVTIIK